LSLFISPGVPSPSVHTLAFSPRRSGRESLKLQTFDYNGIKSAEARRAARAAKAKAQDFAAGAFVEQQPRGPAELRPVPPQAAASFDAEQATVQLAIDAAVAAAAEVLLQQRHCVTSDTLQRTITGFSAKIRELPLPQPESGTAGLSVPAPTPAPSEAPREPTNVIDKETLTQVLTDFVETAYCRRMCDESKVQPLIGSPRHVRIGIMFESVRLVDAKLVVRLHSVFEQRSERLLEQFVKHLRERTPELERLQYEAKSPPSTRTIII